MASESGSEVRLAVSIQSILLKVPQFYKQMAIASGLGDVGLFLEQRITQESIGLNLQEDLARRCDDYGRNT